MKVGISMMGWGAMEVGRGPIGYDDGRGHSDSPTTVDELFVYGRGVRAMVIHGRKVPIPSC